jgi:hypothetical protein
MKNPIQAMFEAGVLQLTDFPPESRYHGVARATVTGPDGIERPYLLRRLSPPPEAFATRQVRPTRQGERLDLIAAAEFGDAQAFWLLMDANGAIWAEELEADGAELRITLPQGVPAPEEG